MKNVKKAISLLLSLMLVLGAVAVCGMTASAAEEYELWVGGVSVTDDNKNDVLGDGTVSYNPVSRTLTLNNANITASGDAICAMENEGSSNLTIILMGKNYLNGGIYALFASSVDTVIDGSQGGTLKAEGEIYVTDAPLTIQNVSNLEVRGEVFCPVSYELSAPYSLKIIDSRVAVESDDTEAIYTVYKPFIISGSSVVTAQASDSAMFFPDGLTLEDGLSLSYPEGGTIGNTRILNPDGTNAKRAVIGNAYYIDPESNPTEGGSVSGGGFYAKDGATATVTATPNTGYHFVNWTENGDEVSTDAEYSFTASGNRELVANFELDTHSVSVTANLTEGGTVTGGGTYNYGGSATVTATPNQHYRFVNWTENGDEVSTDAEYTFTVSGDRELVANFEIQKFTVQFVNDDGTELQSGQVIYGGTPAYTGEEPTKEATAQYTYSFLAWTPSIVPVTGNATYKATYSSTVNEYSVEFVNEDGTELQSGDVAYGETPVYTGETPTKEATDQYTYSFAGWSPEITSVTGEATYTATFTQAPRKYEIKFVNEDGTELQSGDVAYGETPKYTGETPTKTATAEYTYEFKGWSPEISQVSGEATYTATFREIPVDYKLTWTVDGESYKNETVPFGTEIVKPDDPVKEGYTFEWVDDIPATMPAGNVTINGKFTPIEYTAKFVDENGNTVKEVKFTVKTEKLDEPAVPEKTNYTGKWEDYTIGAADMTIKPVYTLGGETVVKAVDTGSEVTSDYKETKEYNFETEYLPEGATTHVFVNGEDKGEGTSVTVEEPTEDYTVECKAFDADGNEIASSGEIKVKVKNSIFDKIKWFFSNLLKNFLDAIFGDFGKIC